MDLVKALNSQYMKEELPEAKVGDTVRPPFIIIFVGYQATCNNPLTAFCFYQNQAFLYFSH